MKGTKVLLTSVLLLVVPTAGIAQRSETKRSRSAPQIVAVPATRGTQPGTVFLRLEYQLRILAQYDPGAMRIHTVFPGGPATRLTLQSDPRRTGTLEPGDIITHVDGRPINDVNDYYRAMYLSGARGGRVTLHVRDVNSGRVFVWEATAEKVGGDSDPPIRPDPQTATRVKFVLIGLTNDEAIGIGAGKNVETLSRYARGLPNFDAATDLVVLTGDKANARTVRAAIRRLRVAPTDTLLCYYAGHGNFDRALADGDSSKGHFLALPGGSMMHRDLLAELRSKNAQLTVLLTDSCNVPGLFFPPRPEGPMDREKPPIRCTTFAKLLRNYAGVVDLNSSTRGQFAWYDHSGGWFTLSMLETLNKWEDEKPVSWDAFLKRTADNTSKTFAVRKRSTLAERGPRDDKTTKTIRQLGDQEDQRPEIYRVEVSAVKR